MSTNYIGNALGTIAQLGQQDVANKLAQNRDARDAEMQGLQINALKTNQAQQASQLDANRVLATSRLVQDAASKGQDPKAVVAQIEPDFPTHWDQQHGQGSWASLSSQDVLGLAKGLEMHAMAQLGQGPEKPKLQAVGADQSLYAIDPDTGLPGAKPVLQGVDKTAQQQAFTAAENAKNRAVTMRGQDLADSNRGVPAGYKQNADGSLSFIPGGPADPETKLQTGLGSREGVMFQRVINSANSAATALKNIAELPVGTSTGIFGVGASPGSSLFASAKGALTNKLAPQEVQDYNTMIAGVGRNLSTIETAGLAPNGSLTASMDSVLMREGDSGITKLRKLAEMRQIIEKGIESNLANPKLPPEQKQLVRNIIQQVTDAIPYTQSDVTKLQAKQAKNPDLTLNDLIKDKGLNKAAPQQPSKIIQHPSGATIQILP